MKLNWKRSFVAIALVSGMTFAQGTVAPVAPVDIITDDQKASLDAAATAEAYDGFSPGSAGLTNETTGQASLTHGNSKGFKGLLKQDTAYGWDGNVVNFKGHYQNEKGPDATTGDLTDNTAENWSAGLRYERYLTPRMALFVGNGYAGDRFKLLDLQINSDIGLKYLWWAQNKANYFFTEAGYRHAYSDNLVPSPTPAGVEEYTNAHIIRLYGEGARSFSDNVYGKLWVELLPDLADTDNFVVNFEPSLNVVLSKNLALSLSYRGSFDNLPVAGADELDGTFAAGLTAKY